MPPPAFREENLPARAGGGPNPLFVGQRGHFPHEVNAGEPMSATAVKLRDALLPPVFTLPDFSPVQGFGGGRGPAFDDGRAAPPDRSRTRRTARSTSLSAGVLADGSPDGYMSAFGTSLRWTRCSGCTTAISTACGRSGAARRPRARRRDQPTEPAWLTWEFPFFDKTGTVVRKRVEEVLDTEDQLGYTYSKLPEPDAGGPRVADLPSRRRPDMPPPELVAATEKPLILQGATVRARLPMSAPTGPAADVDEDCDETRSYLSIDASSKATGTRGCSTGCSSTRPRARR